MAKVFLLCGKIASGKTTYAENYCTKNSALSFSADELILKLFDSCLGEKHRETEDKLTLYFCEKAVKLINLGIDVLLDLGFWKFTSREKVRIFFSEKNIETELLYFEISDEERKRRLYLRNEILSESKDRQYIIDNEKLDRFDMIFEKPENSEKYILISA